MIKKDHTKYSSNLKMIWYLKKYEKILKDDNTTASMLREIYLKIGHISRLRKLVDKISVHKNTPEEVHKWIREDDPKIKNLFRIRRQQEIERDFLETNGTLSWRPHGIV